MKDTDGHTSRFVSTLEFLRDGGFQGLQRRWDGKVDMHGLDFGIIMNRILAKFTTNSRFYNPVHRDS